MIIWVGNQASKKLKIYDVLKKYFINYFPGNYKSCKHWSSFKFCLRWLHGGVDLIRHQHWNTSTAHSEISLNIASKHIQCQKALGSSPFISKPSRIIWNSCNALQWIQTAIYMHLLLHSLTMNIFLKKVIPVYL